MSDNTSTESFIVIDQDAIEAYFDTLIEIASGLSEIANVIERGQQIGLSLPVEYADKARALCAKGREKLSGYYEAPSDNRLLYYVPAHRLQVQLARLEDLLKK
jgi:hypothetical protein